MTGADTAAACRSALARFRAEGLSVGFVPTMGALHEGHLSLIRRAKAENGACAVSVFVNPTQFGPGEDFGKYPRTLERDRQLAREAGADLFWTPSAEEIYPAGYSTYVEENRFSLPLCGPHRPGHFRGVCTVVFNLLQTVRPERLYLGRKDAQQLRVIEKVVADLDLGAEVIGCPTVREPDGLAMSSRNAYLSPEDRKAAPGIFKSLRRAAELFEKGEKNSAALVKTVRDGLESIPGLNIQYVELRRWSDFEETEQVIEPSLLATAVYIGKTRLIDNILL